MSEAEDCLRDAIGFYEGIIERDGFEECDPDGPLCRCGVCHESGCVADKLARARKALRNLPPPPGASS